MCICNSTYSVTELPTIAPIVTYKYNTFLVYSDTMIFEMFLIVSLMFNYFEFYRMQLHCYFVHVVYFYHIYDIAIYLAKKDKDNI